MLFNSLKLRLFFYTINGILYSIRFIVLQEKIVHSISIDCTKIILPGKFNEIGLVKKTYSACNMKLIYASQNWFSSKIIFRILYRERRGQNTNVFTLELLLVYRFREHQEISRWRLQTSLNHPKTYTPNIAVLFEHLKSAITSSRWAKWYNYVLDNAI